MIYSKKCAIYLGILAVSLQFITQEASQQDWSIAMSAIKSGDQQLLATVVPSKIPFYATTRGGKYLFDIARYEKQQSMANYLAWNAIVPAIEQGNLSAVQAIIDGGYINADAQTKGGRSLLDIAQYHKQTAIVNYLNSKLASNTVNIPHISANVGGVGPIEFYDNNAPYYEFTNFYTSTPIKIMGKDWPTSEHFFQAMKFLDPILQDRIRTLTTPREVFDAANGKTGTYKQYIRGNWEEIKDQVMFHVVYAKFSQDSKLKSLLLSTGNRELIEASPYDSYWGYAKDPKTGQPGKNMLGKTLMLVRELLR